ncbi:ABC transporter ATP-binding protein [Minicystis rosea]|nr:ABC transporter ATP-binding protein [Minicystis rosea]
MRPIVVFEGVHARDTAGPRGRARGALSGLSIALTPGVHAFLGTPEDGMLAFLDVVTGARAPQRGRVTVAGHAPADTAFVRGRMGVLGAEPRLPSARTVREAVRLAMRARGESGDRFDAVIDPLGLSHLHARDPRSLSFAEERAVELSLALSTPAPILLVLHEPLSDTAVGKPALVAARLREIAMAGACVIVTTSSPADARSLADRVLVLERGVVVRQAIAGEGLALPAPVELVAWVRDGARVLAAALARRPEVQAVAWEEANGDAGEAWPAASAVRVRGAVAEACAVALAEVAVETGVDIEGIERRSPDLGEVRAATAALWRMARARPPQDGVGPAMAQALAASPPAITPPPVPVEPSIRVAPTPSETPAVASDAEPRPASAESSPRPAMLPEEEKDR